MVDSNSSKDLIDHIKICISQKDWESSASAAINAISKFPKNLYFKKQLILSLDCLKKYDEAISWADIAAKQEIKLMKKSIIPKENQIKSLEKHQRIMIAGYFYSGSGAIADYLSGFPKTTKWTPYGEMRLIKTPGGLWDYRKNYLGKNNQEAILNLYLSIIGEKQTNSIIWGKSNRSSRKIIADTNNAEYIITLLNFWIKEKNKPSKNIKSFYKRSSKFIGEAYDKVCQIYDSERILVDQSINAFRLNLAKLIPPSTFIIVDRDPRDQFNEGKEAWKRLGINKWQSAEEFIFDYKRTRETSYKRAKYLSKRFGHKFYFYKLENFIYDFKRLSSKLKSDLQIEGESKGYNPEESKANIGKYKDNLTSSDCNLIEHELMEYLF